MRKRTTALILAGTLASGAVGAVALTPASASTSNNPISSRLATIKSALSGLVSAGTLTQAQADKVASTLDSRLPKGGPGDERFSPGGPGSDGHFRGPGGRFGGHGLLRDEAGATAKTLGMTEAQLRTALESGKSLADVAKSKNVSVGTLVKALVKVAQDHLAAEVKAGRLTQAQADKIKAKLTERITDRVNHARPARDFGSPHANDTAPSVPGATLNG